MFTLEWPASMLEIVCIPHTKERIFREYLHSNMFQQLRNTLAQKKKKTGRERVLTSSTETDIHQSQFTGKQEPADKLSLVITSLISN